MPDFCEKCKYKDKFYSVQCEEQCRGDYNFYLWVNGLKPLLEKEENQDEV